MCQADKATGFPIQMVGDDQHFTEKCFGLANIGKMFALMLFD